MRIYCHDCEQETEQKFIGANPDNELSLYGCRECDNRTEIDEKETLNMVRKNGHYWVSVKTSNGIRREVVLWVNDMWFVSGCGEYEMERDTYEISNIDEEMITEKQT